MSAERGPAEAPAGAAPASTQQSAFETVAPDPGVVVLRDRYEFHVTRPIPHFGTDIAPAFEVTDRRGVLDGLYGQVALHDLPHRMDLIGVLRSLDDKYLLRPLAAGALTWTPENRVRRAAVFNRPSGEPLLKRLDETFAPYRDDRLIRSVIIPAVAALEELHNRRIVHRNIRPDNIFYLNADRSAIKLGECHMTPPGYQQPFSSESIRGCMTPPHARGAGSVGDDIYALGVTILCMAVGRYPMANLDADAVIAAKIRNGSYAALLGDKTLSANMIEPVRGMLNDDPDERWDLEEVTNWLGGRRVAPRQSRLAPRTSQAFTFEGRKYATAAELARGLAQGWQSALATVSSEDVEQWARRALKDEAAANRIRQYRNCPPEAPARFPSTALADLNLAWLCMALDPSGPIRYKSIITTPTGLGATLALRYDDGAGRNAFVELIMAPLVEQSFINQNTDAARRESRVVLPQLAHLREVLVTPRYGYGLERCLYELNPGLSCKGAMLSRFEIINSEEALPALDQVARDPARPTMPVDRHLAAFVAARLKANLQPALRSYARHAGTDKEILAVLQLLGAIAGRFAKLRAPNLADWLLAMVKPTVNTFRNRPYREQLAADLAAHAKAGRVAQMQRAIEDHDARRRDNEGFRYAVRQLASILEESAFLRHNRAYHDLRARDFGHRVAVTVSASLAAISLSLLSSFM